MALNWNEIKDRAVRFSKDWEDTTSEDAEAKSFLDAFFDVFGILRRKIGTFEHKVKFPNEADGYIDMIWKGHILVEMKSRGKDLDRAFRQAKDYTHGLKQEELPKFILISDFHHFRLYDTEEMSTNEFTLPELYKNVGLFGYLIGVSKKVYKEQDPANIKAAELMGKLHDRLEEIGYEGHPLEVYLVRILFCLFAEDTSIFEKQQFQDFLEQRTNEDGSDLAARLQELFQVLNTDKDKRFKNLDEQLNDFPYVNGKLFEESLPTASFDSKMRKALLDCCYIDWSKISPAIFGSMFQSVMNPKERRNLGAHYTSEKNILKVIRPLFLDDLCKEFESLKGKKNELPKFHQKLSTLNFLDPACGCGNFLVITYRELRVLELDVLREMYKNQMVTDVESVIWINVDQFYGIEYEEFPARIAEVAMWLIDHQMNMLISYEFGQYFARLPLKKAAKIVHGNALKVEWEDVVSKDKLSFIIGNPPFGGKHLQSNEQKHDLIKLMNLVKSPSDLDYVSGWFYNAAKYVQSTNIQVAFVSTNSITQGEQVGLLWNVLINNFNIKINFAHQTFKWNNEAKGVAAVHCIIIGFAIFDKSVKRLFEYESTSSEPHEMIVPQINPYLNSGPLVTINKRKNSICGAPAIKYGNKPTDDGNYIFDDFEKASFLLNEPNAVNLFKRFIGSAEFINNISRWCLWLKDIDPYELKKLPFVLDRIEKVKKFREASSAEPTRKSASYPNLFFYISHPNSSYLVIPETSSERRKFIPIGYMSSNVIASNAVYLIPNASLYTFGIMCSTMHMAWTRVTCGRLKSDYRYSGSIVYNNFPWPMNPSDKRKQDIEEKAQKVLDVRAQFPDSSLADLYDPLTMPPALVKAQNALDKAVDQAYRSQPFTSEANRMEFLFGLYEKYTADLFTVERKGKKN